MPIRSLAAPLALALLFCAPALAGSAFQDGWRPFRDPTVQDYGFQWAKVGHARNADWVGLSFPGGPIVRVGGVDYRYRIAKTEVTNRQYYEFVQAYAPYVPDQYASSLEFRGVGIGLSGNGDYSLAASTAEHGVTVGWRFAARYTNWIHNNKATEPWAFESGVYDTSTFGVAGGGQITDQRERSEGARFFLPTWDEWTKAVHFDPDRFGEGQEGYWLYPYSSDTAPVSGTPETPGAQTNAGTFINYPILSYPGAMTPFGLFDASGSATEWLETLGSSGGARLADSSNSGSHPDQMIDRINRSFGGIPSTLIGIRLASIIPSPGTSLGALSVIAFAAARRRR